MGIFSFHSMLDNLHECDMYCSVNKYIKRKMAVLVKAAKYK